MTTTMAAVETSGWKTCPACGGSGRVAEFPDDYGVGEPCLRCREDGQVEDDEVPG